MSIRSNNIVDTWDGFAYDNQKTPDAYAWNNNYGGIPWNTANSGSGVRYMDVTSGDTYENDGSTFAGRLLYIRWDNVAYQNSTYSFPVDLTGNQDYKFKWIYEYLANSTPGAQINVAISSAQDGTNPIQSKTFTTGAPNVLRVGEMIFKPSTNGTYYITITGDNALFGIGEIQVTPYASTKIVIGKNYTSGTVDMVVNSVTFDTAAYAPMEINDISNVDLSITSDTYVNAYSKSRIILNSSASLYLNNSFSPLINSTVDLNSPDTRLYFENVSPDKVLNSFSNLITIGGTQMENNVNAVVLRYGSGTIIYPHSNSYQPLEVFTEENYGGTSQLYEMVTSYYDLAALDNQIKSFKLKKGYMVTFASNSDGTGYSRVFIAEKEDLNIPVMPPYLYGTVSFIRTMRWHDVGKRGWCGTGYPIDDLQATNSNWFYNWDTGVSSSASIEYVPMRHNLYWPSFNPAYTQEGYTHFLAYNEPDRPDQANMSVQTCIDNWKYFLKSGLRVGSVATSDPFNGYLGNFMAAAEAQNLRVDFIPIHAYWNKSATQWSNDLDWVWNTFHRPVWITEGNKGANWTGNSFPDDPNMLTDANAMHHLNNIKGIIDVLESKDYVERYSLYNWVQDARAFIVNIDDDFKSRNPNWANYEWLKTAPVVYTYNGGIDKRVLTPAGEYYANHATKIAYNPNREYIPTWTPKVETLSYEVSPTFDSIDLNWTGLNDDLVNKYVIERRLEGETVFTVFKEITDYNTLTVNDQVNTTADYRIKVVGKDNAESAYSNIITFTKETPPEAPTGLTGEATSTTIINLSWTAVDGVGYYIVKRADAIDGSYVIVGTNLNDTSFEDSGLTENTTYYYKVSGYNSGGEGTESPVIAIKTLMLQIPGPVTNILAGAGDAQVKFEWDSMYDSQFYIKRSTSQSGSFNTVATLDLGTTAYIDTNITN
ncbi:glycosyl hydrolase, partial [Tenacibaculum sp.]|uniref:glycosyl hydrolase n=1 Tax=Tenacibaculum sp. TaxID=1906242 RepID=UPI003D0A26DB